MNHTLRSSQHLEHCIEPPRFYVPADLSAAKIKTGSFAYFYLGTIKSHHKTGYCFFVASNSTQGAMLRLTRMGNSQQVTSTSIK